MSGLIVKPQRAQDKRFGGTTSIVAPVLVADGQWDAFIPHPELQRDSFGDTFGCVSFSAVNCLETMFRQKNNPGVVAPSFSERFTAKQSGTVPGVGNDFATVADCILNNGVILDIQWPYLPDMTVAQFYADLPQDLIDNAKAYIRYFTIGHQFIWDVWDHIMAALPYGPVQVGIFAYGPLVNGVYHRSEQPGNHAVMIYGYVQGQYWKAFDSEQNTTIKLAWDTLFQGSLQYIIAKVS